MMDGDFYIHNNNQINQLGVNYGQSCPTVIGINIHNKTIVIHQKGCTSWVGRGTSGYSPSETSFGTFESIKKDKNNIKIVGFKNLLEIESKKINAIEKAKLILDKFRGKDEEE